MRFNFGIFLGILLFDQSVYNRRFGRKRSQIRDDRDRRDYGEHDTGDHAVDGQNRSKDFASVRSRWNVYILNIHYDIVADNGKSSRAFLQKANLTIRNVIRLRFSGDNVWCIKIV